MQVLSSIAGMMVPLAIAFLLTTNRRTIRLRTVIGALIIHLAFIVPCWDLGRQALQILTQGVQAVIDTSKESVQFHFCPILPEADSGAVSDVLAIISQDG